MCNLDCNARRGDRKRLLVPADEKLIAFLEIERVIRESPKRIRHYRLSGTQCCLGNAR